MSGQKKNSMFDMLSSLGKSDDGQGLVVPLADIVPDPSQPRKAFDQERLEDLAESIREVGIIEPLVVSPTGAVPPYMLVAGERRWRAAAIAGLEDVPVHVRTDDDTSASRRSLVQLIENANREDLTDLEMARSIQALIDAETNASGKSRGVKTRIAKLLGRPPAAISRFMGMLEPDVLPWSENGLVVHAEAIAMLRTAPDEVRESLLELAADRGEPVRQSEVREALAVHRAALQAGENPPTPADAASSTAASPSAGLENSLQESGGESESEADTAAGVAAGDRDGQEIARPAGEDDDDAGGGTAQGPADSSGVARGGEGEDDDDVGGGEGGPTTGGVASKSAPASKARLPAAALKLSGERIETLLRYFVDKATDTVELRLPADLAVAVIENMGGEVPDRAELYSDRIRDLLSAKEGA